MPPKCHICGRDKRPAGHSGHVLIYRCDCAKAREYWWPYSLLWYPKDLVAIKEPEE